MEDVDADIVPVNVHVDLVDLGHDGDGGGGGVDTPLRLGGGHALHAVDAGLVLQARVRAASDDLEVDLAVAAGFVRARDLCAPASTFRVALVHAEQVGCEQACLVATCAGADLDDHVAVVGGILRDECEFQVTVEALRLGGEAVDLLAGHVLHLVVALAQEDLCLVQFAGGVPPEAEQLDDLLDACALLGDLLDTPMVRGDLWVREHAVQLVVTSLDLGESF